METVTTVVTVASAVIGVAAIGIGCAIPIGSILMLAAFILVVARGGFASVREMFKVGGRQGHQPETRQPVRQRREPVYLRHQKKNTRRTR